MISLIYYILCGVLIFGILGGISMMSKVQFAVLGNRISALCMAGAIFLTMYHNHILNHYWLLGLLVIGVVAGHFWAQRIKMIEMPQVVALLNGFGGAASAIVAYVSLVDAHLLSIFGRVTGAVALTVGFITLSGSLVAAGKLHRVLSQKTIVWKHHGVITSIPLVIIAFCILDSGFGFLSPSISIGLNCVASLFFGVAFAIRVGGADMPITISLLNSLSGVAGAIAGMSIGDSLLVAVGGIVGASGLLLTQMMCVAMNRHLFDILLGKVSSKKKLPQQKVETPIKQLESQTPVAQAVDKKGDPLATAKRVIIVPGYGMAIAQAQHLVKGLADALTAKGADVKFAIHPVAGRMPGHMNVLLAEADVPYDQLYEMDDINPQFPNCDVAIVIGANDVVNSAAKEQEDTPIYGMPILDVDQAKHVIICNYDTKPGYAGVDNPLYQRTEGVTLLFGDAKDSIQNLIKSLKEKQTENTVKPLESPLADAKHVIIVPGYGMAIAQAQHLVKGLADALTAKGADVKFAIHPVAGRMPGHMNVLLAEADVSYDQLYEMDDINPQFPDCDVAIVIGANDVVNSAAKEQEDTPIYGMPILDVDQAKHVIICNYDTKPGYAGVDNPLYQRTEGVTLLLGDAKDSIHTLTKSLEEKQTENTVEPLESPLADAKRVIIVPGYGMAIAQAQHLVKGLADVLTAKGADVKFAIHPVAGRMPGHMNVLLAEADVPYDQLYEMDEINPQFPDCDVAIVIGANDVVNSAAKEQEDTPIYGMPILDVDQAKHVIICNYDTKPGYAGVENPFYQRTEGVTLLLGDAKDSIHTLTKCLKEPLEQ